MPTATAVWFTPATEIPLVIANVLLLAPPPPQAAKPDVPLLFTADTAV